MYYRILLLILQSATALITSKAFCIVRVGPRLILRSTPGSRSFLSTDLFGAGLTVCGYRLHLHLHILSAYPSCLLRRHRSHFLISARMAWGGWFMYLFAIQHPCDGSSWHAHRQRSIKFYAFNRHIWVSTSQDRKLSTNRNGCWMSFLLHFCGHLRYDNFCRFVMAGAVLLPSRRQLEVLFQALHRTVATSGDFGGSA